MKTEICQSCGIPLSENNLGSNSQHSFNTEYCKFCYKNGDFTSPDLSLEEQTKKLIMMASANSKQTKEEAIQIARSVLPGLKRWQKTK